MSFPFITTGQSRSTLLSINRGNKNSFSDIYIHTRLRYRDLSQSFEYTFLISGIEMSEHKGMYTRSDKRNIILNQTINN